MWSEFCDKWPDLLVKLRRKKLFQKFGFKGGNFSCYEIFTQFTHASRNCPSQSRKQQQQKFRKKCFDNVVSDLWKHCLFGHKITLNKEEEKKYTQKKTHKSINNL